MLPSPQPSPANGRGGLWIPTSVGMTGVGGKVKGIGGKDEGIGGKDEGIGEDRGVEG